MRPIPDDVEPVPQHTVAATRTVLDAGVSRVDGAARAPEVAQGERHPECVEGRRPLRIHQVAPDCWSVARGVLERLMRTDSARLTPQLDANGHTTGLLVEDVGEACLAALGFETGDVIHTVNGQDLDRMAFSNIYQSITKAGNAVVRFDRRGRAHTVVYEVSGE